MTPCPHCGRPMPRVRTGGELLKKVRKVVEGSNCRWTMGNIAAEADVRLDKALYNAVGYLVILGVLVRVKRGVYSNEKSTVGAD